MNEILSTLRYEFGSVFSRLRSQPRYALMAAAMLTLAVAGNVAVFTVLSRTLLRSFPFNDERMVMIFSTHRDAAGKVQEFPSGSVDFVYWRMMSSSFEEMAVARVFTGSITDRGHTESIKVGSVSGGVFRLFGVRPALGDDFAPKDDVAESTTAILADGLWRRRFGADHNIVGKSIVIDGSPKTIIGVAPESFEIPNNRADVYVPAGFGLSHLPTPGSRGYAVFARLKPGVSPGAAAEDLQRVSLDLATRFPDSHKEYSAAVKPLREALYGERRRALLTLFVAVLLVHLLACVNVANLMLAQISDQRSVTAVRLAIGARPGTIIRTRILEGLLITISSAALGMLAGTVAVRVILRHYADPALLSPTPGSALSMTLFVVLLTVATTLVVSLVPALREVRVPINALINEGSHRTSASVDARRAREMFIIAEVAIAIPLLIAAAAGLQRFRELRSFDIGFNPDPIMTAQLIMPPRYDQQARSAFVAELIRRLESSPDVASAAVTTSNFRINGGAATVIRSESMADFAFVGFRRITPHFFDVMSSPLIDGRPFNDGDIAGSPPVAIVSESFARQFWPGENAVGKKLVRKSQNAAWLTVVGVARDIRDAGAAEDLGPTVYTPFLQGNFIYVSIVARSKGDPALLGDTITRTVQSIDGKLAPGEVIVFRQLNEESLGSHKLQVTLLSGFGLMALALASFGIFAVTSYAVSQRMAETGVRMAFGATPRTVVIELVQAAGKSVAAGVVLGLAITAGVVRGAPLVSAISPKVDSTYALFVVILLVASALIASLLPALRARGAQPAALLRGA